jgi:hypothetical protein
MKKACPAAVLEERRFSAARMCASATFVTYLVGKLSVRPTF